MQRLVFTYETIFCVGDFNVNNIYSQRTTVLLSLVFLLKKHFCEELQAIPWNNIFILNGIDSKDSSLNDGIISYFNIYAPLTTTTFHKPEVARFTLLRKCNIKNLILSI